MCTSVHTLIVMLGAYEPLKAATSAAHKLLVIHSISSVESLQFV